MHHLVNGDIALAAISADVRGGTVSCVIVLVTKHVVTFRAARPVFGIVPLGRQGVFCAVGLLAARALFPVMRAVILRCGVPMRDLRNGHAGGMTVGTHAGLVAGGTVLAESVDDLAAFRTGKPAFGLGIYAGVDVHAAVGAPGGILGVCKGTQRVFKCLVAADGADIILEGMLGVCGLVAAYRTGEIDEVMLFYGADVQNSTAVGAAAPVCGAVMEELCLSAVDGVVGDDAGSAAVDAHIRRGAGAGVLTVQEIAVLRFKIHRAAAFAAEGDMVVLTVRLIYPGGFGMIAGVFRLITAGHAQVFLVEGVIVAGVVSAVSAGPPVTIRVIFCRSNIEMTAGGIENLVGMVNDAADAAGAAAFAQAGLGAVGGKMAGDGFLFTADAAF